MLLNSRAVTLDVNVNSRAAICKMALYAVRCKCKRQCGNLRNGARCKRKNQGGNLRCKCKQQDGNLPNGALRS